MKKILFLLLILPTATYAADTYKIDPNHANIVWEANHFGFSNPSGKFNGIDGTITLDEADPQNSRVEAIIDINSLNTGLAKFDTHLKSADFFNVEKFATAKFVSTKIETTSKNTAKITGDLTILGITKPVTLNARLNKIGNHPFLQIKTIGFSATTTIKRSDFGMNYGIPGVSDNVKLRLEIEANLSAKKGETPASQENTGLNPSWKIITAESSINFKATQKDSSLNGSFKKFSGVINFDKNQQKGNYVNIDVDTTSIDMSFSDGLEMVKTKPWLATSAFTNANFTADKFTAISDKEMRAEGNLTIKGKKIPVIFKFKFEEYTKTSAVAVGSFPINRSNFGVGQKDENGIDDVVIVSFRIKAER